MVSFLIWLALQDDDGDALPGWVNLRVLLLVCVIVCGSVAMFFRLFE